MGAKVSDSDKEEFAKRLRDSASDNPRIPRLNKGLYQFLATRLVELNLPTSVQAVRKWFGGESIPTRPRIRALASILDIDADWLAVGRSGDEIASAAPRVLENNGAVNLMIGMLEMAGARCAIPEDDVPSDLQVIWNGRMSSLLVFKLPDTGSGEFFLPKGHHRNKSVFVRRLSPLSFEVFYLPPDVAEIHGMPLNGGVSLNIELVGSEPKLGGQSLNRVEDPTSVLN